MNHPLGRACVVLGAGRTRADGAIDHIAGVAALKKTGEWVEAGEPAAMIYASNRAIAEQAMPMVEQAFEWSDEQVRAPALITEVLSGPGAGERS